MSEPLTKEAIEALLKDATPGPWTNVSQSDGSGMICLEYETNNQMSPRGLRLIANVFARKNSLKQDTANMELIAAAPDLAATALAALEPARVWKQRSDVLEGRLIIARGNYRSDQLEAALARIAELEEGLRPFAKMADEVDEWQNTSSDFEGAFSADDLRRARALLAKAPK